MSKLFGTNGIRGVTNRELTPELALGMGKAIGTFFKEGDKLIIGRDVRAGGDMLVRALTSGLLSTGIDVYYAGVLPTPALQYTIKRGGYAGGVMVTASHNPAEFNGIKVIDADGVETDSSNERKIEEHYFSRKFREVEWQKLNHDVHEVHDAIDVYVSAVLKQVDANAIRTRRFKVLIDGGNSVGSITSVRIARELACEIHEVNTKLDPLFPGRQPEPTPISLAKTAELAKKLKVDITVAHDGDADRAIFIDSGNTVQYGDRSGALLAYWVTKKNKGEKKLVFTPFSSSNLVEEFLDAHGIRTERTRIGSVVVSRELISKGGIAGFEDNGGFIYPKHQYVRDGGLALALMLEMMALEDKSSAKLFSMLPAYLSEKIKVPLSGGTDKIFERITARWKDCKVLDTDHDGLKMAGKDFWFIVRKSGTEPVLRISVEAKSEKVLKSTLEDLKKLV